jgi:hypothetical protein
MLFELRNMLLELTGSLDSHLRKLSLTFLQPAGSLRRGVGEQSVMLFELRNTLLELTACLGSDLRKLSLTFLQLTGSFRRGFDEQSVVLFEPGNSLRDCNIVRQKPSVPSPEGKHSYHCP